ncbi:MAG: translocation/assembly module TamB domain-containing protein [Deltaproteobacteria bacterium]|nr:translocation/assembly module TamB domain-containing protein [Deltaproteobacteria bacterium]
MSALEPLPATLRGVRPRRVKKGPLALVLKLVRGALFVVGQALLLAYLLVSRSILLLGALYLVVYFLAGSRPMKAVMQRAVSDNIPGTITAATIQWGPLPWQLRIADGRVFDEHGFETIRVRALDATIDLAATVPGLVAFASDSASHPMTLRFDHVELLEPHASIRVSEAGDVNIERAFSIDGWPPGAPPSEGPPAVMDITVRTVRVIDASGHVEAPGIVASGEGCDTVTDFAMYGSDYHMSYTADVIRMPVAEVRLDFVPFVPGAVRVPVRDLVVDDYRWRALGFGWRRARAALGPSDAPWGTIDASGHLDAEPETVTVGGGARVHLVEGAAVTDALTGGAVFGELDLDLQGAGDVDQVAATWAVSSPRLVLAGLPLEEAQAHGRFAPRGVDPTGDYHGIFVDRLAGTVIDEGDAPPGRLVVKDLVYDAPPPGPHRGWTPRDLQLAFELEGVRGASLLPLLGDAPPAVLVPLASGHVTTRGRVAVQHDTTNGSSFTELELDGGRFAWEGPPPALAGVYDFEGALRMVNKPYESTLALERIVVDRGGDRARLAGTIDLLTGRLDLEPYLRLGDVSRLVGPLGLPPATGRLVLKDARARGTLDDPHVTAGVNWTEASLEGKRIERLQADLDYRRGTLKVTNARTTNALGALALDGQLRLDDPRLDFETTRVDVSSLALGALLGDLGPDAHVDLDASRLAGSLAAPLESLRGRGRLVATNLVVGGEPIQSVEADVEALGDLVSLRNVVVRTRAGTLVGALELDPKRRHVRGQLDVASLDLAALQSVARAAPELGATLGAHLTIGGTFDRPTLIGTIDVRGARWGDTRLGDAQLAVQTLPDGRIDLSALDETFFPGLSLERAEVALGGLVPRRLEAAVRATRLDLGTLVPSLANDAVTIVVSALAEVDLALAGGGPPSTVTLEARPGDLQVTLADRGQTWTNTTALRLERAGEEVSLDPVGLGPRGQPAALELCGTIGRTLDVLVAGRIELAFVPGLSDLFAVTDGRFIVGERDARAGDAHPAADVSVRARRREAETDDTRCLATREALVIGGTPRAPAIAGRLVADDVVLVPRGSGREIRVTDGSTLVLVPASAGGRQVIELPEGGGLRGELDDGTFALTGRVELDGFLPAAIELDLVGADLFLQSPGEYALTASPRGHLSVRDLDGPTPSARISGALAISEGRYAKSFDTIAQAIGGAAGGRSDAYSESILTILPWLAQARLAVDVTAADFQIQTALPLARTDLPARLDLSLGGTLDQPTLHRRIDLLPGGVLTYFVFERVFQVTQGAIDFDGDAERPLVDVTARTHITYLARASTASLEEDEKEVAITMRMTGRVPDLKIELSSDDATLDQADIQSLLLTGKPRGDLDRAQESRVVSADIATFLNTVFAAPFVKTASIAVSQQGALEYRVGTCFAPNLCFDTTTVAAETETTLRARFSLNIGDDLVCEGALRRSDASTTSAQETYEARCRYRIPLE